MRNRIALLCVLATGVAVMSPRVAADETQTNAFPARLTREQWQKLTPEEREARLKTLRAQREKSGDQPVSVRDLIRELPPAEREGKLKELRAQQGLPPLDPEKQKLRDELMQMSPAERQAKLAELRKNRPPPPPVDEKVLEQRRAALLKRLAELRAQRAEGKLTPADEKRLAALEEAEKVMQAHPRASKPADKPAEESAAPASQPH